MTSAAELPNEPQTFGIGRLFWDLHEAIIVGDATTGMVILWNPGAERLFGYPADEIVGQTIETVVPPELWSAHRTGLGHFAATGHGPLIDGRNAVEVPAVRQDGQRITVELTLSPLTSTVESGRFVLAVVRDVSERVRRREQLEAALRLARSLASSNPQAVLEHLRQEAMQATGGDFGVVRRWDPGKEVLEYVAGSTPADQGSAPRGLGNGIAGEAARRRAPVIRDRFPATKDGPGRSNSGATAVVSVPLLYDGRLLGTMTVSSKQAGKTFDDADVEILEVLAGIAAAAVAGLQHAEELRQIAETDVLTGLSTRRAAGDRIEHYLRLATRHQQNLTLVVLDLDHFKQVNDHYGHIAGDAVLWRIAQRLRQAYRAEDVVARWGGEEFLLALYGSVRHDCVRRLETILAQVVAEPFDTEDGGTFSISFSAGVAEFPADGTDLPALYREADRRLYQAKAAGRGRVIAEDNPSSATQA
jgi:diguanylate cyclase (GGDEF)-like protein/PAS domain S-box-containing protein